MYRDSRRRNLKNLPGKVFHYMLRRMKCQSCSTLHTEIPDIIQPYKHYDSQTIQSVLDGSEEAASCAADNSTIRRWKESFNEAEPDINQRLASVYEREAGELPPLTPTTQILKGIRASYKRWLRFVMTLLINKGYKLYTRFAFCPTVPASKIGSSGQNAAKEGVVNDQTTEDSS